MGANVTQPAINIRERLNELDTHNHDCDYVKHGEVFGKNILINSDHSESQRGDYSTATAIVDGTYYLDRFREYISTITGNLTHNAFDTDVGCQTVTLDVTSTASGYLQHTQRVENYQDYAGKIVTFTVQVKSNHACGLYISDGVNVFYSTRHSGNGEWETISLVAMLDKSLTTLLVAVSSYDGAAFSHSNGDYVTVGNSQLELGDKFTGFEVVDPAVNKARCHRYAYDVTEGMTASGDKIALGQCLTTTAAMVIIPLPNMRTAPDNPTFPTPSDFALTSSAGGTLACTSIVLSRKSSNYIALTCSVASGLVAGDVTQLVTNTTSTKLIVTAEI